MADNGEAKLPKSVQVGPFTYTIETDDAALDREGVVARSSIDGLTTYSSLTINVRSSLTPDRAAETLLHEVVHAVNDMIGYSDHADEESWTTRQAPALLDVLLRNPALVSFLVS